MPCQAGPTERETLTAARTELDKLTRENDRLREFLLRLKAGSTLTVREWNWVEHDQVAHRKEDLARLENTLRAAISDRRALATTSIDVTLYARLGLVVTADPAQPLEPQLGFDPDSI